MKKSIEEIKADYHLFIDIQMGKYLSGRKKTEFTSEEEANLIMNKIVETYNQKIASDQMHLDNLNEAAKASWFNSVEIDFSAPGGAASGKEVGSISSGDAKNIIGINKATIDFLSFYDQMFPFLPEGAVMYLMYAGPALEAYGYPIKRFKELIEGKELTRIEEKLLRWAYDLSLKITHAYLEKNKIKKEKYLTDSVSIAVEELDEKKALRVVAEIYANIEENFSDFKKKKQKPKTKKRKK